MTGHKYINTTKTANSPGKPFLKWAGGKGQLLDIFSGYYPNELKQNQIKNYYEPFVGGGAVFFDIVRKFKIESAFLSDINEELILTYQVVQKDVFKLMQQLEDFSKKYQKLDEKSRIIFFYEIRDEFNRNRQLAGYEKYSEKWIKRAAQIIFLNRTCFNGLFRFNSKGEFNVPAGRYKNPKILDEANLKKAASLLSIAQIKKADYNELKLQVTNPSFVYFDPPYRPLNKTSGFTAYSKNRFGDKHQIELATLFSELHQEGAKVMLSNSDPKNIDPSDDFFDHLYSGFHISRVPARRAINSNGLKRNAINEIIVTSYLV
ncbi:MAG: DNA adenine methylase [Bacteroidota bacterium]